jgi:hypothetical protein
MRSNSRSTDADEPYPVHGVPSLASALQNEGHDNALSLCY